MQFHVNKRPTVKGVPKGSWTVHCNLNCSIGRANPANWSIISEPQLLALAQHQSLGACQRCWGGAADGKTIEWQQLLPDS